MTKTTMHHPGQYITVLYFMMGMAMCSFYIHEYKNDPADTIKKQGKAVTGQIKPTETIAFSHFIQ